MSANGVKPENCGNLYKIFPKVEYIETLILHDELFFKSPAEYTHELNVIYSASGDTAEFENQAVCCFSWIDSAIYDKRMWNARADAGRGAMVVFHDLPVAPAADGAFEMLSHGITKRVYISLAGYFTEAELENIRNRLSKEPQSLGKGNIAVPIEPKGFEYENEYRLFYPNPGCKSGEYVNISSAGYFYIKAIVYGYQMADADRRRVENAIRLSGKLGIRIFELNVSLTPKLLAVGSIPVL
jgi:hypothetical protein